MQTNEILFDEQIKNLLIKGYPSLAGITEEKFLSYIHPLKKHLSKISSIHTNIPFVIVIKHNLVATEKVMHHIEIKNKKGIVNMTPYASTDYETLTDIQIPEEMAYLLVDIDTGRETLNVRPHDALAIIKKKNRSPLTIDEGVALVTHFPEILTDKENYNCFQMLASRKNDKTIPSLWVSYKQPRLGWCWEKNPHTWLGSASCKKRLP